MTSTEDCEITFCMPTLQRIPWLKRSLLSIERYCSTSHAIRVLTQGPPKRELVTFMKSLPNAELLTSSTNIGCGAARGILSSGVASDFVMMIDDDTYLTENTITQALSALRRDRRVGAVSMPHYDLNGRMMSTGGKNFTIRNGVILRRRASLDLEVDPVEVDDLDGTMLYKTEMQKSFSWDPNLFVLEDIDRSLQVMRSGEWKQAIAPKAKVIHDRSWVEDPSSENERSNGLIWRRSYRSFRSKWGLRFNLRAHLLLEAVFPALTLMRFGWAMSTLNKLAINRFART